MASKQALGIRRSPRTFVSVLILLPLLLASGCAQTRNLGGEQAIVAPPEGLTVLLMPADVELSLLTTSGLKEPNAEWTEQGRQNVIAALKAEMAERAIKTVSYAGEASKHTEIADEHLQLVKLHEAVGGSIALHKFVPGLELPTKKNKFNWTLGENVQMLRDTYDSNYALFVFAEDSFSSGGRVALQVALALLGAHVQGGQQVAFASLVDLNSGSVVWFNVLNSGVGDLRDPKLARETIDTLLDSAPL